MMRIIRLPFYEVVGDPVLALTELSASNDQLGIAKTAFEIKLRPNHIKLMEKHKDYYKAQLRMCRLDTENEQSDDFPPFCKIKLNGKDVVLPDFIQNLQALLQQKRQSRPVDITENIQSVYLTQTHKLEIQWLNNDQHQKWMVGIWLVLPLTSRTLWSRMVTSGAHQSIETTKEKIIQMLAVDEDGIAMDQLKISLICPISKIRMTIPSRAKNCSHLQCFDLSNFLEINEKTPVWKCPICNGIAHYDNLIIDEYFKDLLKTIEVNVEEVELLRDGSWKTLKLAAPNLHKSGRNEIINLGEDIEVTELDASDCENDEIITVTGSGTSSSTSSAISNSSPKTIPDSEIITLDSDTDDDEPSRPSGHVRTSSNTRNSNDSSPDIIIDSEIITLDDKPDEQPFLSPTGIALARMFARIFLHETRRFA